MAKPIILSIAGNEFSFDLVRVDRAKIYGFRKRIGIDGQGQRCTRGSLTSDGENLLLSGMTAQGYFNADGYSVSRQDMVGIDSSGNQVEQIPSTLGIVEALEGPVEPSEILDLTLESIFSLEPTDTDNELISKLKSGDIFKFPFNYSAGLEMEVAYLLGNEEGIFAIVGKPSIQEWVEEAAIFIPDETDEIDSDDLDFDTL